MIYEFNSRRIIPIAANILPSNLSTLIEQRLIRVIPQPNLLMYVWYMQGICRANLTVVLDLCTCFIFKIVNALNRLKEKLLAIWCEIQTNYSNVSATILKNCQPQIIGESARLTCGYYTLPHYYTNNNNSIPEKLKIFSFMLITFNVWHGWWFCDESIECRNEIWSLIIKKGLIIFKWT
jgi:hypothetical protein